MPAQMQIESVPLADALGAEVHGIDLSVPLSGETVAAIRQTWLDHQVLVFRNQHLTDAQLTDFSRHFGDLDTVPGWEPFSPSGHPEVLIISNVRKDGATIGVLGDGEASWHTDMSYLDQPPPGSLLYSLEVPDTGGDTCFMSMYAALDALPTDIREAIRGKSLNHDSSHDSAGNLRSNHTAFEDVSGAPGAQHPIVRAHPETGRPALFLGRRLHAWIVGESVESSEALLDRIWEHCTRQEFTYCHQWQRGDLLMWDNRCTMHRRDPFDAQARRVMHRTQLKGDAPVRAAASA
jgi:taurine dioxygenase